MNKIYSNNIKLNEFTIKNLTCNDVTTDFRSFRGKSVNLATLFLNKPPGLILYIEHGGFSNCRALCIKLNEFTIKNLTCNDVTTDFRSFRGKSVNLATLFLSKPPGQ